jgi:phosphate transport system substrate-binding protein
MTINRLAPAVAAALAVAVGVAACGSSSNDTSNPTGSGGGSGAKAVTLNGAGSTFAAPVYQEWASQLNAQGITLNYQPVGSGAGVASLQKGTVNFAGSDPSLAREDKSGLKKGAAVQVPMFFGAITLSYNLPSVKQRLKLDGATAADIFAKKITKWNDPALTKLNPGVKLPSTAITVVHRSDSSGTTKGFTTFLSDYSKSWASQYGADTDIKWASGTTGAKGNDGVAAAIKQTEGAIGYVEQAYALQNHFTFFDVKNQAGRYVSPTLDSTTAAGDGLKVPSDLGISTINASNSSAYPIASQTFIDVYKDLCKAGLSKSTAAGLKKFLDFGLNQGQSVAKQLQFATLPDAIKTQAQQAVNGLQCNGQAL